MHGNSDFEAGHEAAAPRPAAARPAEAPRRPAAVEDSASDIVVKRDGQRFGREANMVMTAFSLLVAGVLITWHFWNKEYLSHSEDLVYNLGLVGGILMLFQFIYSARKRIPGMRHLGQIKQWFLVHAAIGVGAPLIIIFHSRFEISSINGGVALISMLVVVFSGVIGRYLLAQTNFDLHLEREALKKLHVKFHQDVLPRHAEIAPMVAQRLKAFTMSAFSVKPGLLNAFMGAATIGLKTQMLYAELSRPQRLVASGAEAAIRMPGDHGGFSPTEKKILKVYLGALVRLARYNAFKQLFALWRIGHVPFIYLLLASGLLHVLAVHMY